MDTSFSLPRKDYMSNCSFRLMKWWWMFTDLFRNPAKRLDEFGIQSGWTVIDYGCGPGRHIRRAAKQAGKEGMVYAVDIHDLAIKCLNRLKVRYQLKNVKPVQAVGYFAPIPEDIADLIYVLDMFHQVSEPRLFLDELHRLVKHRGRVVLEDGHQSRKKTLAEISGSPGWKVLEEHRRYVVLGPAWKIMPEKKAI